MTPADANALAAIQPLLRQLRDLKGVREARTGVFTVRGAAFAHFQVEDGVLLAQLRKPGGSGFDHFPLSNAPQQRKFIDEARLRAGRFDEE